MIKKFLTIILLLVIIIMSILELILCIINSSELISPYILNFIIFIFSILLFIVIISKKTNKINNNKIFINKENNKISITEEAIIQLIKNLFIKDNSISNIKIFIFANKDNEISIEINTYVELGSNIIDITELIRSKIKKTYKENIGDNLSDIRVIITGFVDNKK